MEPDNLSEVRRPGPTHRLAIVGRTGTGKTVAAIWHLSDADFDERPWVILDFKNDELLNAIDRAEPLQLGELPEAPGIYLLKIRPDEKEGITEFFKAAWQRENIGILIDEGYMIDRDDEWFNACLTQGRSKKISMIILSQRPVWLSRFVFSEADFFQVFDLTHDKDMAKVREYIRDDERAQLDTPLLDRHSFYYDVGRKRLETFGPVDHPRELLKTIDERLEELAVEEEYGDEGRPRRRAI